MSCKNELVLIGFLGSQARVEMQITKFATFGPSYSKLKQRILRRLREALYQRGQSLPRIRQRDNWKMVMRRKKILKLNGCGFWRRPET